MPRKRSPCRALIRARGREQKLFSLLSRFSALDLGNLEFWGSICVPSKLFLEKGKSLSVVAAIPEEPLTPGQQRKVAPALPFPPLCDPPA